MVKYANGSIHLEPPTYNAHQNRWAEGNTGSTCTLRSSHEAISKAVSVQPFSQSAPNVDNRFNDHPAKVLRIEPSVSNGPY